MVKRITLAYAPVDRAQRYAMETAAALHAKAYNSDPFARRMSMHYMRMGFEHPDDVIRHAEAVLTARRGRQSAVL